MKSIKSILFLLVFLVRLANDSQHHLCGKHHLQLILELCLAWRWIQCRGPEHFYIQCTGIIMPTNIHNNHHQAPGELVIRAAKQVNMVKDYFIKM